jgi:3-oxoacyl-[acyl-carrier protein] reductase
MPAGRFGRSGVKSSGQKLDGYVAMVTGGGGGIGSEASAWLADLGAHVVVTDLDDSGAARVAARLDAAGRSAQSMGVDVVDGTAVREAVERIVAEHQRLDVLLTCHGFPSDARLHDMTDDAWHSVLNVCLTGTFICIREASRPMVEHEYGRIVTISSRAWHGNPGQANYSAAKAGVVGLTRSVAKELGRHGVTANVIAPGLVDTDSLRALASYGQIADRAKRENSIKRLGNPADVAAAVAFLASPDSGFITGEVLHVSGGRFG